MITEWIRRMLRRIRTTRRSSNRLIVCPRCGSTKIKLTSTFDAWLTPKKYFCPDCGYVGPVVLEIEREKKGES